MVLGFYLEAYQRSDSMSISISKQKKKKGGRKNILINFPQIGFSRVLHNNFIQDSSFNSITIS